MRKFIKFAFKHHKLQVFVILIFLILQTYFQLNIIDLFKDALTHVKMAKLDLLDADGQLMIIYSIILIILMIIIVYLSNNLSVKIAHETRKKIFHIETHMSPDDFNKFSITTLMTRIASDVYTLQNFIQTFLKKIMIIPFIAAGTIIEISLIDSIFGFFLTIFVIIVTIIIHYQLKQVASDYFKVKHINSRINFLFKEKILGLKTIRVFKKKLFERKKFNEVINESYNISLRFQLNQYYISPLLIFISDLLIVFLLIHLFNHTLDPSTTIINHPKHYTTFVDMVIIIQYLLYFATTLLSLHDLVENSPKSYVSASRLEELLDLEETNIKNKQKILKSDFKGIEFRNVSYNNNDHDLVRDISFKIPDKTNTAIVGSYSSGKTVLMYLLNGLYKADEGEILIDGYDINDLTSDELKCKINFAIQKKFIFHDTVYNNIVLGDKLITKNDVIKACDASGLSKLFSDDLNLDTLILENTSNISAEFKEKIMLTRSLVREKDIYIFDEFDYLVENKTNIILTKNIKQIKDIEHIIVLDEGQIIGEGNHEELLKNCLAYQELYVEGE